MEGQWKKDVPKRAIDLSEQLPWVYMGFYAEKYQCLLSEQVL